jgi:hypothetical protein
MSEFGRSVKEEGMMLEIERGSVRHDEPVPAKAFLHYRLGGGGLLARC